MTKADKRNRSRSLKQTILSAVKSSVKRIGPRNRQALTRIPLAVALYRRVLHSLVTLPIENGTLPSDIYGFKMYLDPKDDTGCLSYYLSGNYEPVTSAVFGQALSEGDTVVDVGAHWGYYTLLAASLCGSTGRVFAFEPHPANFTLLTKSLQANHFANVMAVQKAVSDRVGETNLFLSRHSVRHSICGVPDHWRVGSDYGQDNLKVDVTTLDAFFSKTALRPRVVKIDVEGAEPLVLNGMQSLRDGNSSLVLVAECNPECLDAGAITRLVETLASDGSEVGVIDDDQGRLHVGPPPVVLERILRGGTITNLLATRDRAVVDSLLKRQGKKLHKRAQR